MISLKPSPSRSTPLASEAPRRSLAGAKKYVGEKPFPLVVRFAIASTHTKLLPGFGPGEPIAIEVGDTTAIVLP